MNLLATLIALGAALPCGLPGRKPLKLRTVPHPWAVYLARSAPRVSSGLGRIPTKPLTLENRPILTDRDVRVYHWKTHALTLTIAARKRLRKHWRSLRGRTFVVTVAGKKLYAGLVYSLLYSKSRAVPVLLPTRVGVRIDRAYPTARYATVSDPRPQAAVKKVFKRLRRLR